MLKILALQQNNMHFRQSDISPQNSDGMFLFGVVFCLPCLCINGFARESLLLTFKSSAEDTASWLVSRESGSEVPLPRRSCLTAV